MNSTKTQEKHSYMYMFSIISSIIVTQTILHNDHLSDSLYVHTCVNLSMMAASPQQEWP